MSLMLFDKRINVRLKATKEGSEDTYDVRIDTPATGRKPSIHLQGRMVPSELVTSVSLRMVNFYSTVPLDTYKYIAIYAGYGENVELVCEGEILFAYEETPGPDGITVFEIILGFLDTILETTMEIAVKKGTALDTILKEIADKTGLALANYTPKLTILSTKFEHTGRVREVLDKLKTIYPALVVRLDGKRLIAYTDAIGTGVVHTLTYVNSAKKDASGYSIKAPWVPAIRPGDVIDIDLKFFKQSYGGAQVAFGRFFSILTVDFSFSTVEPVNNMSLTVLGIPETTVRQASNDVLLLRGLA